MKLFVTTDDLLRAYFEGGGELHTYPENARTMSDHDIAERIEEKRLADAVANFERNRN